jgi:hypothetical protein
MENRSRREFFTDSARMVAAGLATGTPLLALQGCDTLAPSERTLLIEPATYFVNVREGGIEIFNSETGTRIGAEVRLEPLREVEEDDNIDVGFQFVENAPTQAVISGPAHSIQPGSPDDLRRWSQQFPGFFVYFGLVHTHELRPCVTVPVKHVHLTVKRWSWTDDRQAWTHLHIGMYGNRGSRCFVIYDNLHPWICIKTPCTPSWSALKDGIKQGLRLGLAAAGVVVAAWVIEAAAATLATALFGLILI